MINYRAFSILAFLLANFGQTELAVVLNRFGLTRRTLFYDLEKLNFWMKKEKIGKIEVSEGKVYLKSSSYQEIQNKMDSLPLSQYVLSNEERIIFATLIIGTFSATVTMEKICELLMISRNTGKSTINDLRLSLKNNRLYLSSSRTGYCLEGNEMIIRHYLFKLLSGSCSQSPLHRFIVDYLERCFGGEDSRAQAGSFEKIKQVFENTLKNGNYVFTDSMINTLALQVLISAIRSNMGFQVEFDQQEAEEIARTDEFGIAMDMAHRLEKENVILSPDTYLYLSTMLLGIRGTEVHMNDGTEAGITQFTEELVEKMERKMQVIFPQKEELKDVLRSHIQPMYYRLKHGVIAENPLESEIRSSYPFVYQLVLQSIDEISSQIAFDLPPQEAAYLCIYFVSWLKRHGLECRENGLRRILIICHSGMGTSLFLQEQLVNLLGEGYTCQITSVHEVGNYSFEDYLFILSTLDLGYHCEKFMVVNPLLTDENKRRILSFLAKSSCYAARDVRINDLIEIMRKNGSVTNQEQLMLDLIQYFSGEPKGSAAGNRTIPFELFTGKAEGKYQFHDALKRVVQPFIQHNITTWRYLESLEEIIDTYGLYFEISEGILLAHSHTTVPMSKVALSVCVFREGVEYPQYQKRFHTIFAFTSPDSAQHVTMMKGLLEFISFDGNKERLAKGDFASAEELQQEINRFYQKKY